MHLTGKEYQMLELLSLRKGTTLTKEMFLNHLYGGMDEPELKIIDVFICKLRKKLAAATEGDNYIETVWGRGYVLRDPRMANEIVAGRVSAVSTEHSKRAPLAAPFFISDRAVQQLVVQRRADQQPLARRQPPTLAPPISLPSLP